MVWRWRLRGQRREVWEGWLVNPPTRLARSTQALDRIQTEESAATRRMVPSRSYEEKPKRAFRVPEPALTRTPLRTLFARGNRSLDKGGVTGNLPTSPAADPCPT